jgi:hypothetical protein
MTKATHSQLVASGYIFQGINNELSVFAQSNRHFVKLKDGIVVRFDSEEPTILNIKSKYLKKYGITTI